MRFGCRPQCGGIPGVGVFSHCAPPETQTVRTKAAAIAPVRFMERVMREICAGNVAAC
jgi:hypothetical protein